MHLNECGQLIKHRNQLNSSTKVHLQYVHSQYRFTASPAERNAREKAKHMFHDDSKLFDSAHTAASVC